MANPNPVPQGMHTVTPSLTIQGCAAALDFYKRALGAEEVMRMPSPDGKSVWHAELRVGDSMIFAGDEMPGGPFRAPSAAHPSPASLWLYVPDCDAAFRRAVDAGAKAVMPPEDMFWGDRVSMVLDPYGYGWHFATHVKDLSPEEMRNGAEEFAKRMKR
ncbi:VOC family protein [Anaeromyxobacter diazotrophicus]|uniref:Glyoxalase/bleomycin resistance protein/dioxygenase superfamily protein n=1 Tax=Anaeromyxobacter diazotrophicus TaxID=2590199 RepID=A0A7I9VKL2_9BACT|nr:VOC family protein [Anaeromyxobacter diazotrophicus]GEJ56956.1 glyoxalase/bleomycin resistance protein/dioxygenase superfamily protein [Anaeromyxobacter diazotrophicus]